MYEKSGSLSSSETPTEYNHDQMLSRVQFFRNLALTQQLCIYERVNVLSGL